MNNQSIEPKTLLIVWAYFPATGHLVEVIDIAAAYKKSNPTIKISVVINNKTAYKVVEYCDWIENCIAVDIKDIVLNNSNSTYLSNISRDWDYIIYPKRLKYTPGDFTHDLLTCNNILRDFFIARVCSGYHFEKESPNSLPFTKSAALKITLPSSYTAWANNYKNDGPLFTIMLEGASPQKIYPSLGWWKKVMKTIRTRYPNVRILLTGVIPHHLGGTYSKKYKQKIEDITHSIPNTEYCYDIGIEKQLALIELSDVFISPHTGFAFLAPCVGTPWLCISGTYWSEQVFANMPFYSVLPKCTHYPCHGNTKWQCKLLLKAKQQTLCMGLNLNGRIPDLLYGLDVLMNSEINFDLSVRLYKAQALQKHIDIKKITFLNELTQELI